MKRVNITLKQQRAAELTLENLANGNKKTKGQILKEAGYEKTVQENTTNVFHSPGFKRAIAELSAALNIDKESRLMKLAEMFWTSDDPREVAIINKEIASMQGDYAPQQKEIKDLRNERERIIVKPE